MSSSIMTLPELSAEAAPTGENLEHHADFVAMERAAEHKPETQYGDIITPATPPDWKAVEAFAVSLLERTRDLRILVHLAVARLNLSGPSAFAEVLVPILNLLNTQWDAVHPQLDPEDDNDPLMRANTLSRLRDERNVLRTLRELPLARSAKTGPINWRDIAILDGRIEAEPGREKPNEALIRDAFNKTDPGQLKVLRDGVDLAAEQVAAISLAFDNLAGPRLDLSGLSRLLESIRKDLRRFEPVIVEDAAEISEPEVEAALIPDAGQPAPGQPAVVARRVTARSITSVSARDDALYLLQVVAAYFRTNEPSSPVPLLIDRALRVANLDFIGILQDIAPDGLGQAQIVAGKPPG